MIIFPNIESLIKDIFSYEFPWLFMVVPAILALTILFFFSIYLGLTLCGFKRKIYREKSMQKRSEDIIKAFKIKHEQGIISREQFESIKQQYSKE
jgi:uncharacterized membrane protein